MPFIMDSPNIELLSALAGLLEAGKYSDLKIICRGKEYAVHRAIVCSRSGFFDGACSNSFKEAESGVIDLSEDDEEAVQHMVHYFYHLDYLSRSLSRRTSQRSSRSWPASPRSPTSPRSPRSARRGKPGRLNLALIEDPLLAQAAASPANPITPLEDPATRPESLGKAVLDDCEEEEEDDELLESPIAESSASQTQSYLVAHAKVYALAEKYGISGLKTLARKKFIAQINLFWEHESFSDAIEEVYESTIDTDRGLRDVVIQAFRSHPDLSRREDVEAAVKATPQLAWELFKVSSGMPIR